MEFYEFKASQSYHTEILFQKIFLSFYLMCMNVCLHVCPCATCVQCLQRSEEKHRILCMLLLGLNLWLLRIASVSVAKTSL